MIKIEKISKSYGSFKAIDQVSLVAHPGKLTVLLGENGAGKSTTIKSIAGLLNFEGNITICDAENRSQAAKKSFGYIPEVPVLYDLLTVQEHIDFIGNAYCVSNYQETADKFLTLFDLTEKRKVLAKELSKGMRQKMSILLALITQPKALLVDEPMIGLDPQSIEEVLHIFEMLKKRANEYFN